MLRHYRSNPSHVLSLEEIEIQPNLSYSEEPIKILARGIQEVRNKRVPLVKFFYIGTE